MFLIRLLLNWRVYLLSLLLLVVAMMSLSPEKMDQYAGWWLEHQHIQYTTWQTARKKVKLPAWYNCIHSTICALRSQKNNSENRDKNLLILCCLLLGVGLFCIYLAAWIMTRLVKEDKIRFSKDKILMGASNIIKLGVAVSILSGSIGETQTTINTSLGRPHYQQPYALIEGSCPAPISAIPVPPPTDKSQTTRNNAGW